MLNVHLRSTASNAGRTLGNWNDRRARYPDRVFDAPPLYRLLDRLAGWLYRRLP